MERNLLLVNEIARAKAKWLLAHQCMEVGSRNYGGFLFEHSFADARCTGYEINALFAVYLYPDFPEYYQQTAILDRLIAGMDFLRRRQRPDGSIDLGGGGVGGGNEVGFTLPGVCQSYLRLEKSEAPGRDKLLPVLCDYIVRGAACVRRYFPYTSNHRWAACAGPLAWAHSLFPDPENVKVIEEYLGDGIDMDSTGLYYEERSPNYDQVANTGLLDLAYVYGRRDLLDYVRRNLEFTLAMQQSNGECETLFSHRQDRGVTGFPVYAFEVFQRMAVEFNRGDFATMADRILTEGNLEKVGMTFGRPTRYLFDDPHIREENVARAPLPEKFELRCTGAPIWRWRKGELAATVVADAGGHFWDCTYGGWGAPNRSASFFDFHAGTAIIDTIKILWETGTAAFRPESIEYLADGSMKLFYRDPGADHISHFRPRAKWQPRKILTDQWAEVVIARQQRGFRLALRVDGWPEMPINIQLLLRENCRLESSSGLTTLEKGGHTFTDGSVYELIGPDGSRMRIGGLPASEHTTLLGDGRAITGEAEKRCHRLAAGIFTPCAFELNLEAVKQA